MKKQNINRVILFQIDKTSRVAKAHTQRAFDGLKLGVTVEQMILLKIIEESEQLSQKELATKSLRDPASITRTLDILAKKGYVQREAIPNNRRQYNIRLTAAGLAFVQKHMSLVVEHRQKSTQGFTDEEVELFRSFLLRVQKNMS